MTIQFDNGFATADGLITVYCIDAQGVYTGSAQFEACKGFGLPPDMFLDKPELKIKTGEAIRRQGDQWVKVKDFRGTEIYSKATGEALTVDFIGEIPETHTTEPRPDEFYIWSGSGWILDEASQQEARQSAHKQEKERLLSLATEQMAILQDAVELEIATDQEVEQLQVWKKFRILVNRIDTSQPGAQFPELPN